MAVVLISMQKNEMAKALMYIRIIKNQWVRKRQ